MATRRHDAHTTRMPQAMVPAQVLPRIRCAQCGFMFFGTPGNRCEICRAKDVPHEAPETPESPTTASAPAEPWRREVERQLAELEHRAQTLLADVAGLRQELRHTHPRQGDGGA